MVQRIIAFKPEYHDNNINAQFTIYQLFDLSLYKFALSAAEAAAAMSKPEVSQTLNSILPASFAFDINETGLTIAPGQNLDESYRHHAQLMPIYPLANWMQTIRADKKLSIFPLHGNQMGNEVVRLFFFPGLPAFILQEQNRADSAGETTIFATNFVRLTAI